jgi:cation transport ATPase
MITINAQEKSNRKKVNIQVSGICDMCKSRIEKAAFKTKGVKSADWSIATKSLSLVINENKTDVLTIQQNLAAIGHDTAVVQASDEAYNSLHGCCKYERTFVKSNCKDKKDEAKSCCASKVKASTSCASK